MNSATPTAPARAPTAIPCSAPCRTTADPPRRWRWVQAARPSTRATPRVAGRPAGQPGSTRPSPLCRWQRGHAAWCDIGAYEAESLASYPQWDGGQAFTCEVTFAGAVECFGRNKEGQATPRAAPSRRSARAECTPAPQRRRRQSRLLGQQFDAGAQLRLGDL